MHVMMEKISKVRDHAAAIGFVVVCAEDSCQRGIPVERRLDSSERVGVYLRIGVDTAGRSTAAGVARRS